MPAEAAPEPHRSRPFRFTVQASHLGSPHELLEIARRAEDVGVSVLTVADHLDDQLAPVAALMAAADATSTMRVGSLVFANDYRHPAVLAREVATIDRLSDGRCEFGLGAGWMASDYRSAGFAFDAPAERIARLEEALVLIKALWSGEPVTHDGRFYDTDSLALAPTPQQDPHPPVWVGGGGRRVLEVAARHADVVHLNPSLRAGVIDHRAGPSATAAATHRKLGWIREAAPERFEQLEVGVRIHLALVTDDRDAMFDALSGGFGLTADEARGSPHALCGSTSEIEEDLLARREEFGISNIGLSASSLEDLAPVISRLAGA